MHKTIQPPGWRRPTGYANGVLATGSVLEIAGQIGWNEDKEFVSNEFAGQMEQALLNIKAILETAGGSPEHLTRLTWYVTDKSDYLANQKQIGEAYRRVLGSVFPAMSMLVVAGLVEDLALVEIEATAVLPL